MLCTVGISQTDTPCLILNNQQRKMPEFITKEKNLRVIIDHKLNFSSHKVTQVKKANKIMGLIGRSYTHLERTSFVAYSIP